MSSKNSYEMNWWDDRQIGIDRLLDLDIEVMHDEGFPANREFYYRTDDVLTTPADMDRFLYTNEDEELVGYGGLETVEDGVYEIRRVRVKPEKQSQGFGTVIAATLETYADLQGGASVLVKTLDSFDKAQGFWRSRGYGLVDESPPEEGSDDYHWKTMRKKL